METNGKMGSKKARDIIKAKRLEKKVTIAELAKTVGKNPTFLAAALHGNHRLRQDEAKKVGTALELDKETTESLAKFQVRTDFPNTTDPFKYRIMEIIGEYGDGLRDMTKEMSRNGLLRAIEVTLSTNRLTH